MSNLFKGIYVGNNAVTISHLQYADDTILFGYWSKKNVKYCFKILKCFEIFSGLKVNFTKSCLYGIGIQNAVVENMASYCGCQVDNLPFLYLGLPKGKKMNTIRDWDSYREKFHSRLANWKVKTMLFGGRLTLIKSVLSSLPLYAFSLFHAPSCVINKLEGNQPLCDRLGRLYKLDSNRDVLVAERIMNTIADYVFNWQWTRIPTGRTLDELE
ncbi:uncharacterized protein [Rutidosis leptorrhynchoides]|uniref:uncharacterized protein n=1 Tax=Rutidosis leptorrhynchoides TaxID=125765 RepID=UPI003A99E2A0